MVYAINTEFYCNCYYYCICIHNFVFYACYRVCAVVMATITALISLYAFEDINQSMQVS